MKMTRVFVPGNDSVMASMGLLVLRCWFGGALLFLHGLDKLTHFGELSKTFPDPLHVGSTVSLVLAVFAEAVCSALLILGLVTRFASAVLAINMAVALTLVHQMQLTGEHNGESAFIYLGAFATLLIAGPGRFSTDAVAFGKA